ncbi:hypothetical protein ID854_08505 [Xenorhabdus sp. M]|uniref:Uncharacterized protein n=1 Tax=Xenorhabdus szentirmaii TaxID=290112 RepID=A0AAW3YTY2_9GAMM|nr:MULTISPECIES: hypothetical protein [unclassified Xenorhabdus]MBD2800499.1 hypothetical protein [Xenorhabdus sp. M]MBD2805300.1 hypothetical protein [Xenorhabdus sp. ZM]
MAAKYAFNLIVKIALLIMIMLFFIKYAPYDEFVDHFIMQHISFDDAEKIDKVLFNDPESNSHESVKAYFTLLINILISIPLLSMLTTAFDTGAWKKKSMTLLKKWALTTMRRFTKLFIFIFIFWVQIRFLLFQFAFPPKLAYLFFMILVAIIGFNLWITMGCYRFIIKKIKRNL